MRYKHTFSGRRASQSDYELTGLINVLKANGVTRYLEIGARDGDSFHEIMSSLPRGSYGVAVDMPGGLWGKETTSGNLIKAINDLRANGYDVQYILGDSTDKEIIDKVRSLGPFDAALIDGDHTLEGVTRDWDNYNSMADIIAFHDIIGFGQAEKVHGNKVEVPLLWKKLKYQFENHKEIIDKMSKMGIGVIFK